MHGEAAPAERCCWHGDFKRSPAHAEYRERMALEREWAKKLHSAQLEAAQKLAEVEAFAKAKAAEAEELAGKKLELEKAVERVLMLEEANKRERQARTTAVNEFNDLARASQARLFDIAHKHGFSH